MTCNTKLKVSKTDMKDKARKAAIVFLRNVYADVDNYCFDCWDYRGEDLFITTVFADIRDAFGSHRLEEFYVEYDRAENSVEVYQLDSLGKSHLESEEEQ